LEAGAQVSVVKAGFTSSSGKVRALLVYAKKGLSDEEQKEAAPNRVK